jgi:hypothetical protein
MPIRGRLNKFKGNYVCMLTQLITWNEKGKTDFVNGDMAVFPSNGSICIFLEDAKSTRPMNPIGRITSGLEIFSETGGGDVLTISVDKLG